MRHAERNYPRQNASVIGRIELVRASWYHPRDNVDLRFAIAANFPLTWVSWLRVDARLVFRHRRTF